MVKLNLYSVVLQLSNQDLIFTNLLLLHGKIMMDKLMKYRLALLLIIFLVKIKREVMDLLRQKMDLYNSIVGN